jgi:hypothetical protein
MEVPCTVKSSMAGDAGHSFVDQRSVVVPQRNGTHGRGDPSQWVNGSSRKDKTAGPAPVDTRR